ncbi:MAG: rRNA maturation RNase YbeY [Acidimicrobiales bacterium]
MTLLRRAPTAAAAPAVPDVPDVVISDEQREVIVDAAALANLAAATLVAEGVGGDAELNLTFVAEDVMAALNAEHMHEDGPTDVLAFPLDDPHEDRPAGMVALLGDVVICPAVAARYATEHDRTLDQELSLLVVHGVLHVLGHDHADEDEAAVMRHRELAHLRAFVDPGTTL